MTSRDERVEAFLQDALSLQDERLAQVREGVRIYIARYEKDFGNGHSTNENRTRKVLFRESAALVARIGSNLRSQFGILANTDANRRECRAN